MILTVVRLVAHGLVIVLAVAYCVEWQLKRVTLKQSLVDIGAALKDAYGKVNGMIVRLRTPKADS